MPAFDYALPFAVPPEREGPESLLASAIRAEEARREAFDLAMLEYERGLDLWEEEAVTEPEAEDLSLRWPCGCECREGTMVAFCAEADRLWAVFRVTSGGITEPAWQPYRAHFLDQEATKG